MVLVGSLLHYLAILWYVAPGEGNVSHLRDSVAITLPTCSIFALLSAPWHSNVVLIGAAVAINAVLEITNSFLNVFAPDFLG